MQTSFWRRDVFTWVVLGCLAFVFLTIIAMFFYPGGTFTDFTTRGYSFFENFFSELGMLHTHTGGPKWVSFILFVVAMLLVGGGMILFFYAFLRSVHGTRTDRLLAWLGSCLGSLSALCFWGVAAFPADVNLSAHTNFVIWAFRLFPLAVLFIIIILFRQQGAASVYAWELVVFMLMLVAYLLLLELGPTIHSYGGMLVQAVGQKVIVYASILSVMFQAWGMRNSAA